MVLETLERLDVRSAKLTLVDKGALDCTIRARVESAVYRSIGQSEGIPTVFPQQLCHIHIACNLAVSG